MKNSTNNTKHSFDLNNLDDRYEVRFEYDRKGNLIRVWREEKSSRPQFDPIIIGFILSGLLAIGMLCF